MFHLSWLIVPNTNCSKFQSRFVSLKLFIIHIFKSSDILLVVWMIFWTKMVPHKIWTTITVLGTPTRWVNSLFLWILEPIPSKFSNNNMQLWYGEAIDTNVLLPNMDGGTQALFLKNITILGMFTLPMKMFLHPMPMKEDYGNIYCR